MNHELPTEEQEQKTLIQWLKHKKIFHFAPMNENKQSFGNRNIAIKIANKSKSMGKVKGTSDLIVMLNDKILFIELKRKAKMLKNGKKSFSHTKVSTEQKEFLDSVNGFSYAFGAVCYGARESINFIEGHL